MTVKELSQSVGFKSIVTPSPEREIKGVYIGDLLSWVMGRASEDNVWITIMSNVNILAVATLADVSCIILAEGVTLDEATLNTAVSKGINIIGTDESAYQAASRLCSMGL